MKKIILTLSVLILTTGMALAGMSLDAAKDAGLVGEQPDGLVGIVTSSPSAEVEALVNEVNAGRLKKYQSISEKNGTDRLQVQALAGRQLITKTPSGQYIKNAGGGWQKK